MTLYYSPTGGFLDSDFNSLVPDDSVAITPELHEALIQGQSASRKIIISTNGLPMLSEPDIAVVKKEAMATDNQQYQTEILNGFDSSALGSNYHYSSSQSDQQLLMSLVMTNSEGSLYCSDNSGDWAVLEHTAEQVMQVLKDMNKFLQSRKKVLAAKLIAINNATKVAEVINA